MFGIGWTEILLVGLVALFVLKPKDYPDAMRAIGNFIRKARVMAGEFQLQFNDAMREANLDDVRKTIEEVRDLRGLSPMQHVTEALSKFADETKSIKQEIEAPLASATQPATPALEAPQPAEPAAVADTAATAPTHDQARPIDLVPASAPPAAEPSHAASEPSHAMPEPEHAVAATPGPHRVA